MAQQTEITSEIFFSSLDLSHFQEQTKFMTG